MRHLGYTLQVKSHAATERARFIRLEAGQKRKWLAKLAISAQSRPRPLVLSPRPHQDFKRGIAR